MMRSTPAELTLEADPVWLDEIRAHAGEAGADPELTIDASPELVDVIRGEIARRDATAGERQPPPRASGRVTADRRRHPPLGRRSRRRRHPRRCRDRLHRAVRGRRARPAPAAGSPSSGWPPGRR